MKINPKITPLSKLVGEDNRVMLSAVQYDGQKAVATDGYQMTIVTDKAVEKPETSPVLLSADALKTIKNLPIPKQTKQTQYGPGIEIHVEPGKEIPSEPFDKKTYEPDTFKVVNRDDNTEVTAQVQSPHTAGKFPDYQRLLPKEQDKPIQFEYDARLLVRSLQAIIDLQGGKHKFAVPVSLKFSDRDSPVKIVSETDTFEIEQVIMPFRDTLSSDPGYKREVKISERIAAAAKKIRADVAREEAEKKAA